MTILLIILAILTGLYAFAMILFAMGFDRLIAPHPRNQFKVSIIVAVRNEEKNIPALMPSLLNQDYPDRDYEIIMVDDASTDSTASLLSEYAARVTTPSITILQSKGREKVISAKKHALAQGIRCAKGDILLFTDADCIPARSWVSGMVSYFRPNVGMVIGFSPLEIPPPRSLLTLFQAIESLSLAALAGGSAGWGRPATCSGRNLAYRKSIFHKVGGFEDIKQFASGDDDLFLKIVVNKTKWKIAYAFHANTVVPTRSTQKLKPLILQRLRHASKGLHYGWKMSSILSLVYLYNLLIMISIFCALFSNFTIWPFFFCFTKAASELVLLGAFAMPMSRSRYLYVLPLATLAHLPYVVFFGALGPFIKIRWKPEH
ncbi:glycosyltransferase [candidate division KSB1 bacterium]|nr:glycosyltransferase [candidate division KSB1 bacterium]